MTYVTVGIGVRYSITSEDTSAVALSFLFEATTFPAPPPMSSVSITGNNRPSSFIIGWRWFPHGATGSLWCQPASPPQCIAEEREKEREGVCASFLISLSSSKEGSDAWLCSSHIRDWYWMNKSLSALQSHWTYIYIPTKQLIDRAFMTETFYLKKSYLIFECNSGLFAGSAASCPMPQYILHLMYFSITSLHENACQTVCDIQYIL